MKKFKLLRDTLHSKEIRQQDLADHIAETLGGTCSLSHISNLINGRNQWDLDEMYATLELLNVEPEQLHVFFPKGGDRI